jgi:cbb3-type cytochrome oxidase subunit 3
MTWEFWFTIGIALILIGAIIWAFVGVKKKENPVRLSN